jgi:hypothetical protein
MLQRLWLIHVFCLLEDLIEVKCLLLLIQGSIVFFYCICVCLLFNFDEVVSPWPSSSTEVLHFFLYEPVAVPEQVRGHVFVKVKIHSFGDAEGT